MKFECEVCKKVVIGEEQWNQHIKGRVHKRHVEGLKRKEMREKYFEKKEKMQKNYLVFVSYTIIKMDEMRKEMEDEVTNIVTELTIFVRVQKSRLSDIYTQIGFKENELQDIAQRIQELKNGITSLTSIRGFKGYNQICNQIVYLLFQMIK